MTDGVELATERWGDPAAPCLLFAHGFGQTRHAWSGACRALAANGWQCLSFDARGHGESDRMPAGNYHLQQFINDLQALAYAESEPPVLIGASMGGLLGIALAGTSPSPPLSALVLVDITPRWEASGVERILAFMRAYPEGFVDIDEVTTAIGKYLPHRREHKNEERLRALLRSSDDGRLHWHWDPELLDAVAGEGERYQPMLLEATRNIRLPTLLISGGRSDVVSDRTVDEFLQLLPQAQHVRIPKATHMVAGDANDAFTTEIENFVRALPQAVRTNEVNTT